MRMSGWTLFFCVCGLLLSFALLIIDEKRRQHELLLMERMRNSMLYYDLYPMVLYARKHEIDRVMGAERERAAEAAAALKEREKMNRRAAAELLQQWK